jgi:hypothetical protein
MLLRGTSCLCAVYLFLEVGFLAEEPPAVAVAGDEVWPVMGQEDARGLLQLHCATTSSSHNSVQWQRRQMGWDNLGASGLLELLIPCNMSQLLLLKAN